jgi:hypothetical protein
MTNPIRPQEVRLDIVVLDRRRICFNSSFSGTSFIGLKLGPADGPALKRSGLPNLSLFTLQKPEPGADYVVMVKKAGASG